MRPPFVLASLIHFMSSAFMMFAVLRFGDADVPGVLFITLIGFLFLLGSHRGMRWIVWVGPPFFVLLALANVLAGIGQGNFAFYLIACGYAYLAWYLVRFRPVVAVSHPLILDQNEPVNVQSIDVPPQSFLHGGEVFHYPLLLRRVQALFIDGMILLFVMILVMLVSEGSPNQTAIRISFAIAISLFYEPLLTVYGGTIGQRAMGIRVRRSNDPDKGISLPQAYIRVIVKGFLGWLSFITIHFNVRHQAIHDWMASSVMIRLREPGM